MFYNLLQPFTCHFLRMFSARKLGAKHTAFRISGFGDSDFGFGIRFLGGDTAFTPHFVLECPDTPRLDASHRVMAT